MLLENTQVMEYERKASAGERFFMRSPFSIVTMVARIRGEVSEDALKDAVAKVQQRHALLNLRVKYDQDHTQWFTSEGVEGIPIKVVSRNSENDWIKFHAEASRIPYEFEIQPAIRFVLVQSLDVSELIILCHHTICDGMSLAYLARDLMVHLGDPGRKAEVLPTPAAIDLDNLPGDVSQSGVVKFLIKRMNKKWAEERVAFDHEDYMELTKSYWDNYNHKLFSIELSQEETSALVSRCRMEKVTVNSALSAAFGGAQSFVKGEKPHLPKYMVAANLRERIPNPPGEGIGMYAGGVQLKFKYNHKISFWGNARKFHEEIKPKFTNKNLFSEILNWLYLDATIFEAMQFKKLGRLLPPDSARYEKLSAFSNREDVVLKILQRDNIDSLEIKHWGTAVTNLGHLDFPETYGALELDRLIFKPGGGIPLANVNLLLGAVTCSGKLSLVVEYAEEAVDSGTMEKFKDKAMEFLLG